MVNGNSKIYTHNCKETGNYTSTLDNFPQYLFENSMSCLVRKKLFGSGGIRNHASEETGALNQRLGPLGHTTHDAMCLVLSQFLAK